MKRDGSELRNYLFQRVMNMDKHSLERPVRESLRDKAKNLSNQVVSRIKHKQSVNILLIGASGTGKQLIIDQAVQAARDQVGQVKVTKISGLVHAKDISSALEFEFDRDEHEIILLEDLVSLSQHERWLYGLLEESRKYAKIVIATSTKLDCLESLEKRIRSRFSSSVMVLTPPTERELLEIWKSSLKLDADFIEWPEEKRDMWNENLDDLFDTYNSDFDRMMKRTLNVGTIQALSIPAISALDNDCIEIDGSLIVEQIDYGTDISILSGCSVYELITVLCYCSLRKKGKDPIHFIALYAEFSVWKNQHNEKRYEITRNEFKKCFERLIQLNILSYEKQDKGVQKIYLPVRCSVPLEHLHAKLLSSPILPVEIVEKTGKFMAG